MSKQGLSTISNLIEKIMHVETEISSRAIKNLETKINLKTINLNELDLNSINKLISVLIDWVSKNNIAQYENLVFKAIYIAKESLKYSNNLIINNLKSKNVLNLITNILNSRVSQSISEICEEFIRVFLAKETNANFVLDNIPIQNTLYTSNISKSLNDISYISNSKIHQNKNILNNFSQEREQNFTFNNQLNNINNNNNTFYNGSYNANTLNNNISNSLVYNHNTINDYSALNSNTFGNIVGNELNKNLNPPYQNTKQTDYPNLSNNHPHSPHIPNNTNRNSTNNTKINPSFAENNTDCNSNINLCNYTNESKMKIEKNLNLNGVSNFPLINISRQEEQALYDANINLKFGDYLHISKTLNNVYFNILNEYPIEYLLQNSEIIKSILIILEKSNHLEYGNILFRILYKSFDLIEKKINIFSHNLSTKSNSIYDSTKSTNIGASSNPIFYPGFTDNQINNNNQEDRIKERGGNFKHKISTENCISIRDFLIICAEALIISTYKFEKLSYAVILLEKNLCFLKKLMIDNNDDEWTIIIRQLFNKLYEVILFFKSKSLNFHLLSIVLLRFVLSLSDSAFIKFSSNTNFEIIAIVKEVIFIFDDTQSNLVEKTLSKVKRIISKNASNQKLLEVLNDLISDYEKAEIIRASIDIAKRITKSTIGYNNEKSSDTLRYSMEEYRFILNNFNNIILAYKYFIDTNEQTFMNCVLGLIRERENNQNDFNRCYNSNSKVYKRYVSSSKANDYNNVNYNIVENKMEFINNKFENSTSDEFSFIKFLSQCFSYSNTNEDYLNENRNNVSNNNSNNEIYACFLKLISFLNSLNGDCPFKYLTYLDFLTELQESENLVRLKDQSSEILLGIVNDLAQSIENKNAKLENCILEIIHEINFKNTIQDVENIGINYNKNSNANTGKNTNNNYYLFEVLPVYIKNMKMLSLNSKIDKNFLNLNLKILKYLRQLYSTNELIRLNAINFFKNIFNINSNLNFLEDKIIEYVEFTNNYENLKRLDTIYSIQTAEKEYEKLYRDIISVYQNNIEIEFYPILNILYSNKMDYNMKTAAIEQLINLTFYKKFSQNFCNEIIFFCYDILLNKFNEYKNVFEKNIIYNNNNKKDDYNFVQDYNNLNSFLEDFYKDANLNYISALMKLINFTILNNSENESIKNFLQIKKNEKLINFLHGIIILLFPSDYIENYLNADFKKPRNKHMLNVNFIYFIYLVSFNLKSSYSKIIANNVFLNSNFYEENNNLNQYVKNKQNFLLNNYSFMEIHKQYFFNIIPLKNDVRFSLEGTDKISDDENLNNDSNSLIMKNNDLNENNKKRNKTKWDNYNIKRNIIELIRFKNFYSQKSNSENLNFEVFLKDLHDEKFLKQRLVFYLNESNEPNFMEIFVNTSKLFDFYLTENYRFLFSNIKSKNIGKEKSKPNLNDRTVGNTKTKVHIENENDNNNTNNINSANSTQIYELRNFEKQETNLLIQIFSFLKCLMPNTAEEKNIIIDLINNIKVFLSFYTKFVDFKNYNDEKFLNEKSKNINSNFDKVDITNYEKYLKGLENSSDEIFLPLIKKGLNDCLYNYLSFICNSKNFFTEFQKNTDNQLFLIEILDLIIYNEEIFDSEFYTTNSKTISFIIKTYINLFLNSELLNTVRLLVTKLAINLFKIANKEISSIIKNDSNSKQMKTNNSNDSLVNNNNSLNNFICENKIFLNIIIDSIDFFVSNYKHSKLKNLSNSRFNKKNNFVEYNEDELGNIQTCYPKDPNEIAFKDLGLLKSNLLLLSKILDFTNINSIGSHKIYSNELQNKIASKSFTLLRYFEFELTTEQDEMGNKLCDHIVFTDVIILILEVLEKIKTQEGKLDIVKTNPMILSSLFDFVLKNSAQSVLVIAIVNFTNLFIEYLLKNNNTQNKSEIADRMGSRKNKIFENSLNNQYNAVNRNFIQNEENVDNENSNNQNNCNNNFDNFNASQNLDNINPINEDVMSGSTKKFNNNFNQDYYNNQEERVTQNENFLEEIIILNEKVYDITSLMNLLNLIKKNLKNSLLCANLVSLLKQLILLAKMRNESNEMLADNINYNNYQKNHLDAHNKIQSNIYDLICNTSFFEVQNEIFKTQLENFEFIINFVGDDFLNNFFPVSAANTQQAQNKISKITDNYSVTHYNAIYYDKLHSKINKLHDISESLILFGTILDMFCIIFAKCSNFTALFENNKIIILENLNNAFKMASLMKGFKSKLNKKDYLLFFEANGFSQIFKSLITKFFSLIHLLYHKNVKIVNEALLESSLFVNDFYKANINEKFEEVNDFNTNYKLKNSILNIPNRKLDTDFENESSFNNSKMEQTNNKNNSNIAKNISMNVENLNKEKFSVENSKVYKFIQVSYDLLVLEENDNLEIKVYFAKILPYLIETIICFNKKLNALNNNSKLEVYHNNLFNKPDENVNKLHKLYESCFKNESEASVENGFLKLKNEGETILQLMTGLKQVYKIKYENNDLKNKVRFYFENSELTEKNSLIFAISSLLLVSQTAKRLFIKSNFISTFIDYIRQLSEKLLDLNLENSKEKEFNKVNKSKINSNLNTNNINSTNISYSKNLNHDNNFLEFNQNNNKDILQYVISEYNNVLILLQNLFCDFQNCEEKESLFIPIEIINQNFLNSNITNISNLNNNSILSKTSSKNANLGSNQNSNQTNSTSTAKNLTRNKNTTTINAQNHNKKSKINYEINLSSFENSRNSVNSSGLYSATVNPPNHLAANLLKTLYEIFQDTIQHEVIHENYLKLLINIISKNDHAKKSFIISVTNPEAIGNKDSFVIILLEYLQKKFLNNNLNNTYFCNEANLTSIDLFIKLLKCLFQNKQIVSFLLKIKFVENFQKDLIALLSNKRYYTNKNNQICLTYLLDIMVSLSFDSEIRKKIANKELLEIFTDAVIRIKNENVVYNILFVLRNLSFVNQNKAHFLANENLLGTVFAVLSGDFSLRIKYIISHLLWILLFNNQTLKAILNKEAFKNELITTQLHLQKEHDVKKYMQGEQENNKKLANYDKYLEESCMNFKKIIYILDS